MGAIPVRSQVPSQRRVRWNPRLKQAVWLAAARVLSARVIAGGSGRHVCFGLRWIRLRRSIGCPRSGNASRQTSIFYGDQMHDDPWSRCKRPVTRKRRVRPHDGLANWVVTLRHTTTLTRLFHPLASGKKPRQRRCQLLVGGVIQGRTQIFEKAAQRRADHAAGSRPGIVGA